MSVKQFSAFFGISIATVMGVVGGTRWRNIEVRRAELNNQYQDILEETRAMNEDLLKRKEALADKTSKNDRMHETVDILWRDRLQRYHDTNLDLHAYIRALPEALGILHGLTNHYDYMTKTMRSFVGFDIACGKVHNLAVLIDHGRAVGMERVRETLSSLYASEPVVVAVCDSLAPVAHVSAPRSVGEAAETFAFCMDDLHKAVTAATDAFRESDTAVLNRQQQQQQQQQQQSGGGGVVMDGIRHVLRALRVDPLSREQRDLESKRARLDELLVHEQAQLHTVADVHAALKFTTEVQERLRQPDGSDEFALYVRTLREDPEVVRCLQQLELWRNAATAFLINQQAYDVLHSYQVLLSETLTHVNKSKK